MTEESEGDSEGDSDPEDGDSKKGEDASGGANGECASGDKVKETSGIDWGKSGDCSDFSDLGDVIKKPRSSCPKLGGLTLAGDYGGFGGVFRDRKGASPKSIKEGRSIGVGVFGRAEGEREGDSHGRKESESELSFQQSCVQRGYKEEGISIVNHRPGAIAGRGHPGCVSLFVGNIPVSLSPRRLKLIFMEFGDVIDVFISQKSSKIHNSRFAFVRFKSRVEAERAIQGMDGAEIEGQFVVVNVARFSRAESMKQHTSQSAPDNIQYAEQGKHWTKDSGGLSYAQVVRRSESHIRDSSSARRKISISSKNLDWLSASLVGTLRVGFELGNVKDILIGLSAEVKEVSLLGGCRVLVSFSSVLSRNEALEDCVWNKWFFSMEPWKVESGSGLYRIWITCVGVPVTAWNKDVFALIGKQWGRLIGVDEETLNRSQYVFACLLIESNLHVIDESIALDVDGFFYDVQVSSFSHPGLGDAQCSKSLMERGLGSCSGGSCNFVEHPKVKDQADSAGNVSFASQSSGICHTNEPNNTEGMICSDSKLSLRNGKEVADDIIPVLFGFKDENATWILDEDAGCLTRINGKESVYRCALSERDMSGCNHTARGPDVIFHKMKVQKEALDFSRKSTLSNSDEEIITNSAGALVSVDELAVLGKSGVCKAGGKSELISFTEKEFGIENSRVLEDKNAGGMVNRDQVGVKISDESGGAAKISVVPLKKFEVTQDFINSSINLTTDVLVECKIQGITISESVQKIITEAMTKRHIQAEVDFYEESSNVG